MSLIIAKVPFRLPLGGGGTDLPSYYKMFGGELITASINKYMYVLINKPDISDKYKLHYSQTESVNDVSEIKHDIIRECLKLHNVENIEINSIADIGAKTGMGSSSAFTVALLAGLNSLQNKPIDNYDLAEEACKVEIEMVGNPIGKQDQYAVTFGGINELSIDKDGKVFVCPLVLNNISEIESRLLMFYTGITRDANEILAEQGKKIDQLEVIDAMHEIKDIGLCIKQNLYNGDIDAFGFNLHRHWIVKKTISTKMSSDNIDECYKVALRNGALGGKIMGAGGGGLLLLCCYEGKREILKASMESLGLKYMNFKFEFDGVQVIEDI